MAFRYPQPDNEDGFEQTCLRFYRQHLSRQGMQLYAKRGEKQDGIDILDPLCMQPVYAIQCKHHEEHKTLPPAEIRAEVVKAEKSVHEIDHYIIATSAKKSRHAQDCVAKLNGRKVKKFTVEVHFWEDICQYLSELHLGQAEFIVYGQRILAGSAELSLTFVRQSLPIVEGLLSDRKLEAAAHELEKLEAEHASSPLSSPDHYKLKRLRGKLELEHGDYESAGKHFLDAFSLHPDSDEAKQNRVYGTLLLGDWTAAFNLAQEYVSSGTVTPVMVSHLIHTAESVAALDAHWEAINLYVDSDENVNLALAHKYVMANRSVEAAPYAAKALAISPDSSHALHANGMVAHERAIHGAWKDRQANLTLAFKRYTAARDIAIAEKHGNLLPEIHVHRGAICMLRGDLASASDDYLAAAGCIVDSNAYAARAVSFFLHNRMYSEGWKLIKKLDRSSREGEFLAIASEYHNSEGKVKRECIDRMHELGSLDWIGSDECPFHCVQWAIDEKDLELAVRCVTAKFRNSHPLQSQTLLGWIAIERGDKAAAKAHTAAALEQSISGVHRQELRLLGSILLELADVQNAATVFEQVAIPGHFDDDMRKFIHCAQQLERHDWLLRICRELRETESQDDRVRKLELQLTSEYLPEAAFELASHFIEQADEAAYFIAFRNYLAVRLKRECEIAADPAILPKPSEIHPDESQLVTLPYVATGQFDLALEFLYTQLQQNFDDEHAHGRYIHYVLTYGPKTRLGETPNEAGSGTAVCLQSSGGKIRWVVIKDDDPKSSRHEHSSSSEFGKLLIGLKLDDEIDIPGLLNSEVATVAELQSQYLRAFQDSISSFRDRFPDSSFIQQFESYKDGKLDIEPMLKSLEGRRNHIDACIEVYRDETLPLHFLSRRLGHNFLNTVQCLANHPSGIVKCAETNPLVFAQESKDGMKASILVVGLSALTTLSLADNLELGIGNARLVIAQSTSEEIDSWIAEAEESRTSTYANLSDAGGLVLTEISADDRLANIYQLRKIRRWIDTFCEVRSSGLAATLEPDRRELYLDAIGRHGLESICIASDLNAHLWSDDLVLSMIGKIDFGINFLWTQIVFKELVVDGLLPEGQFQLLTAKLVSWKYAQIVWDAETILAAAKHAEWDASRWPLRQSIELIGNRTVPRRARARILLSTFKLLRRSDCIELKQTPIIQALLDAFNDPKAIVWMRGQLENVFPIDFMSVDFIELELAYWLKPQ